MRIPSNLRHPLTPNTGVGMWSLALAGTAFAATAAVGAAFTAGLEPADSFSDNWALAAVGSAILLISAAAIAVGLTAFFARRERSAAVAVAVLVAGLLAALMLQQVAEGAGWWGS